MRASGRRRLATATICLVLCGVRSAAAQPPAEDPIAEAPIRFGPIGLAPTVSLTNLGVDTNVFNTADNPQSDVTATGSPALKLWLRTHRGVLSIDGRVDLVYFNKFSSERAVNGSGSAMYEYRFNRFRPFVTFSGLNARERPGYEIDIRARRFETNLTGGIDVRVASKSFLAIAARQQQVHYAGDAVFAGQPLNQALNRSVEAADLTWRQNLTVLTTWVVQASGERERYEFGASRNADSVRVKTGFELGRFALIRGSAFVGYRRMEPAADGTIPAFSGVTADVDVSYTAPSQTRLAAAVTRDAVPSYQALAPYYVQTGWNATVTQRVTGRWDVQAQGGRDRLAYQSIAGAPDRGLDWIDRVGGGIGYQLGDDVRASVDVISYRRRSVDPTANYKALRAGMSLVYGF